MLHFNNHHSRLSRNLPILCAAITLFLILIPHYLIAAALHRTVIQSDDLKEANSLNGEAIRLYQSGKYDEAIPLMQRALSIYEKALSPEHPAVATTLNNLAEFYRAKGDYARAEALMQRALAIREKALPPDHPDVAASLSTLR